MQYVMMVGDGVMDDFYFSAESCESVN